MQNFFLDTLDTNLQIHNNTGSPQFWLQTPIQGLSSPSIRLDSYDKPGEDGGEVGSLYYGGRTVILPGFFIGTSVAQYEANRILLGHSLSIRRDINGKPQPLRCSFTTVGGSQYFFDGYLGKEPVFDWDGMKYGKFLIQLYVKKAGIFSSNMVTSPALYVASSSGTTLPWTLPVTLAASNGGTMTITNQGNGIAVPTIRYVGTLTNPQVINVNTGVYMKLNYTVPSGNYVSVDMSEKLVLLSGTSPIPNAKSSGSAWWGFGAGNTLVQILTDNSADTGYVEFDYYHTYAGI